MKAIFVHGVPDTGLVWDEVRDELDDLESLAPSLPGFGNAAPAGFDFSKEAYFTWITEFIEANHPPVHLVGHDWGGILVQRISAVRPDLVRSWAVGGGPIDAEYEWHHNARIWQTEGAGERWWKSKGTIVMGAAMFAAGVPWRNAFQASRMIDGEMKKAILALYRSARRLGDEWSPDVHKLNGAGLVFWGKKDPFCPILYGRKLSKATGARLLELDCGHWTPQQRPKLLAAALRQHWAAHGVRETLAQGICRHLT